MNCSRVKSDSNVGVIVRVRVPPPPLPIHPHRQVSTRRGERRTRLLRAEGVRDRDPEVVQGGAV